MGDFDNKADEWAGAAKEKVGDVTNNEDLKTEGAMDKAKAKAKQSLENAKDDLTDVAEAAKDRARSTFD